MSTCKRVWGPAYVVESLKALEDKLGIVGGESPGVVITVWQAYAGL